MTDKLITDLQELDAITGDTYVPVRNAASGTRKYNLKALKDTVDAAAQAADDAATDARAAAAGVDASKEAAQQAAATANDASQRAEAAIEAIGDISELAVPLMSESTRGGATLGQGLTVDGGALSIGDVVTDETNGPIYSVDAEGWAEQDGTPTPDNPQEVRVCRGRNLLDFDANTFDGYTSSNGQVFADSINKSVIVNVEPNTAYTFSGKHAVADDFAINEFSAYPATGDSGFRRTASITTLVACETFTTQPTTHFLMIKIANTRAVDFDATKATCQLELGSTPTPYVPYGHVGLEVRDSSDELVSVTPIPLPAKGFAAALPDGTADALAIDSAGGYEWTNSTDEISLNGSEQWVAASGGDTGTYYIANNNIKRLSDYSNALMCDHLPVASSHGNTKNVTAISAYNGSSYVGRNWVYANVIGVTSASELAQFFTSHITALLYPLATPTTEHGYIDLPTIPEGATITIPELREVGVKCFVPGVSELIDHANNWGARCKENESRIAALEAAIANLATS